jgi:hypothetical protein
LDEEEPPGAISRCARSRPPSTRSDVRPSVGADRGDPEDPGFFQHPASLSHPAATAPRWLYRGFSVVTNAVIEDLFLPYARVAGTGVWPERFRCPSTELHVTVGRNAKIDWTALCQRIGHADVAFTMKWYVQTDLEADRQVAINLAT